VDLKEQEARKSPEVLAQSKIATSKKRTDSEKKEDLKHKILS